MYPTSNYKRDSLDPKGVMSDDMRGDNYGGVSWAS